MIIAIVGIKHTEGAVQELMALGTVLSGSRLLNVKSSSTRPQDSPSWKCCQLETTALVGLDFAGEPVSFRV